MKATISLPNGTKVEVDCSFEEIMRLVSEHRASVFIPTCSCNSTFPCLQHPRFPRRVDG
jgi:hypothetical protein